MKTVNDIVNSILSESVIFNDDSYQGAHGKKPRGQGNWYISHAKSIDFSKHKEGEDYVSHNGSLTDAKKKAAKVLGPKHSVLHVCS